MKTLALILISFSCLAQQPAVMDPILIQDLDFTLVRPEFGKIYRVMLRKDHALLAEGIADSTWVTICYGCQIPSQPPTAETVTVDSEELTYSGWARHGATSDTNWYKSTISYSSVGEALYTFTGTGIEIHGEIGPNHGSGTVSIGAQSKTASWQSATRTLPAKVVEFKGLPPGEHTLVIKPVSGTILIDFLVIVK